ncbi:hypothetical protein EBR44_12830, partial [bacterium]|nr:hypothetical protein [bacterium]
MGFATAPLLGQRTSVEEMPTLRANQEHVQGARARFDSIGSFSDPQAFVGQFRADAEMRDVDGRRITGAESIRDWWDPRSRGGAKMRVTRESRLTAACVDGAYEVGRLRIEPEGGATPERGFQGIYAMRWRSENGGPMGIQRMLLSTDSWKLDLNWISEGCTEILPEQFRAHRVQLLVGRAKRPTFEREVANALRSTSGTLYGSVSDEPLFVDELTIRIALPAVTLEFGGETRTDRRFWWVARYVPYAPPNTGAGQEFDATLTDREAHALVLRRIRGVSFGLGVTVTRTILATK